MFGGKVNQDIQMSEEIGKQDGEYENIQYEDVEDEDITYINDEDELNSQIDPETLLEEGNILKKSREFDVAIVKLYWALTNKINRLGISEDCGVDPRLAEYYLSYADVLFEKEENSTNFFQSKTISQHCTDYIATLSPNHGEQLQSREVSLLPSSSSSSSSSDTKAIEIQNIQSNETTDEEIAWENFEAAKLAYMKRIELHKRSGYESFCNTGIIPEYITDIFSSINDATSQSFESLLETICNHRKDENIIIKDVLFKDISDLSFTFMRLGDMLQLAEKYEEARLEYKYALYVLESFNAPLDTLESPLICLAQSTLFSGKIKDSKKIFERALTLVKQHLNGDNGMTPPSREIIDIYKVTIEDLQITLDDINKKLAIDPNDQKPISAVPKLEMMEQEKTFSKPQLSENENIKVVKADISNYQEEIYPNFGDNQKKRRIDLTKI
ncbi:uncharacterized protein CMU_042720 [Cryptosporidium muris RN66]|uniref:Tetratricopeptide SHNi-TPR domain-containing protein n=1 Tax=Cryptosporidium muris (strain RN66) TaxID=441375 RepID=B6AAF7_CRYMR|nr:uncharacterized protein CMU_042720 [Cryptosporidium muris RN66]EEA05198.1 hypothetical protein, conserved [Cryptosporidium muris RN66]|eukprot:XP_002139547.1 hypothetical protein [Cryptosporidium muris RN66]